MSNKGEKTLMVIDAIANNSTEEMTNDQYTTLIEKVCAKNKITLNELCKTLAEGLEANKMTLDKYGEEHFEIDHGNRHKYLMSALELLKYIKGGGVNVQVVNISIEERELLDAYKRDMMGSKN